MEIKKLFEYFDKLGFEIAKKLWADISEGINPLLNHSHIYLLLFIRNEGRCMVTHIAKHLGITLSAATGSINKLFDMGLVTRERSEKDRRIVYISLTKGGNEVLYNVDKNRRKLYEKYFYNLTTNELDIFIKIINKISENIKENIS